MALAHDVEAFAVGLHQPVFDAVMHHLDEVPCAVGTAVQIAEMRGTAFCGAAVSGLHFALSWRQRLEDWFELPEDIGLGPDHQAVTAIYAPDAAAGARIDVVNAAGFEGFRAANVVFVIRIAAVDEGVAWLEEVGQLIDHRFGGLAGGHHQPCDARLGQEFDETFDVGCAFDAFFFELGDGRRVQIEGDDLVTALRQTARHVAAHLA